MTTTVTHVNPYQVEARRGGKLIAYAIADRWGWACMAPVWRPKRRDVPEGWYLATVQRIDYGSTARRNARVGQRLLEMAVRA